MFRTFACFLIACCYVGTANAQEPESPVEAPRLPNSYTVELSEYHLERPLSPSQPVDDVLERLTKNQDGQSGKLVETIRFSTLMGNESMLQFGKRVQMVAGTTTGRGGTIRNMQSVDVGTLILATVAPQDGKVSLSLTYESSKIDAAKDDDTPPEISKTKIRTVQLLELGKPALVVSSTRGSTSVIVAKVTQD